ncbi:hypothetical protein [Pseudomonas panipatensis]|uniref:Uncharacterized protein n=1 Tax=Pseudomonas panipatensis TaxID=428992 RepID=A0A1G8LI95_9PSED|nr:hypothetical protein [Pseudomonas panipatensis]SDI55167.1 hypothetical protein SAMN05216272_111158 [Pseudomonas panipatensis]SMP74896.1 hypothetical protein SAMN06295951_11342 [Pseudomonas panipatensis]
MSEFKREARFIVIKRKHLSAESRVHDSLEQELRVWLDKHLIPTSECVVVESDWPEYETVWAMIAARVEGRPTPYQVLEQQVAALRQHKNDYMEAAEGTRRALNSELEKKGLLLSEMHEALSVADDRIEAAKSETQALREEVAALRARVVVDEDGAFEEWWEDSGFYKFRETALSAWEARARLNSKTVSEGLLRRIDLVLAAIRSHDFHGIITSTIGDNWREEVDAMRRELRELLDEGRES